MTPAGVALRVSVVMPATVKSSNREIAEFARHAEDGGLDGIFVGDHLAPATPQPDSTIVLAIAAAATERVTLGFGVMVLALRGPAWAAKQVATLQTLSAGRLVLGVGAGGDMHGTAAWRAVGVPYAERGTLTDDALRVLPDLITGTETVTPGSPPCCWPGSFLPRVVDYAGLPTRSAGPNPFWRSVAPRFWAPLSPPSETASYAP